MHILPKSFYERPTVDVACDLLGTLLVRTWNGVTLAGIITETEAYGGADDPASHAFKKQTLRNQAMFGPVGHSYVYFIYGCHHCLNVVAKDRQAPAGAVLIRGLKPHAGVEEMCKFRSTTKHNNLTNGPGKIGQALQLNVTNSHIDMTQPGELYIMQGSAIQQSKIIATPRIGISKGTDKLWRFVLKKP